ncbi:tryptophan halogenase family protein [Massilia sp. TS11]|uniref:tryptophan halogenase family protein n=1 Tax=Massilia sp. TS11 TaxID=2908003 RepID=UPI001EDBB66D|nr:tryptophan halogenase family protein [Massilia sp. TS11]MCG2586292.1 tryptophan 7-halogenase [Massilia sp. TS11]
MATAGVKRILIVGGGSAGWLCAAYLAKALGGVQIRLVEAPEVGAIGVGEGSFPSLRSTLAALGISEARFVRDCGATFKQGIVFRDWVRGDDAYLHPFSLPSQRPGAPELLPYWLRGLAGDTPFAEAVTLQAAVVAAARGPKHAGDPPYQGALNYAYHFDAARFAALLAAHARALGVTHLQDHVEGAQLDAAGQIACVHTRQHGALEADLYIDCSGFRALLIGAALQAPFHSVADTLFCDSALAVQVPYPQPDAPIASATISSARTAGWIWDIGLQERRGIGYVYSSRHTDDEAAARVLRSYAGSAAEDLALRKIPMRLGYRRQQWIGNCVAIGLAGGFVEPLEASGIGLVETAVQMLAALFPHNGEMAPAARHFNAFMTARYAGIVDFLKLHYCLSQRRDSAFWSDNADPASWTPALRDKLAMWRCRPPQRLDFLTDVEMYPPSSWQFVLYGMGFPRAMPDSPGLAAQAAAAQAEFANLAKLAPHAAAGLPAHRELVAALCARAV